MSLVVCVNEIYCEVRCQCLHLVSGHKTLLTCDTQHVCVTSRVLLAVIVRFHLSQLPLKEGEGEMLNQ